MTLTSHIACRLAVGLILLTAGVSKGQSFSISTVVDLSTAVPGGTPGEVFASFFSVSLSGGRVAFLGVGDMGTSGIYSDAGAALAAVADTSTVVPGGAPGEVFAGFFSVSLSGGSVAFCGVGDMGTRGIYSDLGGALAAVADTSTAVPGAPAEVFTGFGFSVSLSGGSVAFLGVSDMGTPGIYLESGGTLAAVANTSTLVPGGVPGETFSAVSVPSLSGGSVAFLGFGEMGTRGVYRDAGGALAAVADTTTAMPGGAPGEVFISFEPPSLSGGSVAFWGFGDMGTAGIYRDAGGALEVVARNSTTSVPGGAPGETFANFSLSPTPSISHGRVSFRGVGDMATRGIYSDAGGALAVVADNSTTVPGGTPGEIFASFDSHSLSGGSVAFSGSGDMGTVGIYLAALVPPVPVVVVPTLGRRGLALLALVLLVAALADLRRRQAALGRCHGTVDLRAR